MGRVYFIERHSNPYFLGSKQGDFFPKKFIFNPTRYVNTTISKIARRYGYVFNLLKHIHKVMRLNLWFSCFIRTFVEEIKPFPCGIQQEVKEQSFFFKASKLFRNKISQHLREPAADMISHKRFFRNSAWKHLFVKTQNKQGAEWNTSGRHGIQHLHSPAILHTHGQSFLPARIQKGIHKLILSYLFVQAVQGTKCMH